MPSTALPEQLKFIERPPNVHALVAAGPGTGKTFVLDERSQFLVANGVLADSIALITLTRSMARSLSDRVTHGEASTLHAFALRHLNRIGAAWGKSVATPWEEDQLLATDMQVVYLATFKNRIGLTAVKKFLERLGEGFSSNQNTPPNPSPQELQLLQVFRHLQQLIAFALLKELVYDLNQVLEQDVDLVDPPTHLLVDEYQDLTAGELRLLQLLCEHHGSRISACGDDRQSIYGFRSADPLALHRFPDVYRPPEVDSLTRSKRLPLSMCKLANYIAATLQPIPGLARPLLEPWEGRTDVGTLEAKTFPSLKQECEAIGTKVRDKLASGRSLDDIIVITATCHDPMLAALQEYAKPIAGVDFVDAREAAVVPTNEELLLRAIRLLEVRRGLQLGARLLTKLCSNLGDIRIAQILNAPGVDYSARVNHVADRDPVVARVRDATRAILIAHKESDTDRVELALAVAQILKLQVDEAVLRKLTTEPDPATPASETPEEHATSVLVHTVHSSKGLECPVVFLTTVVQEAFVGRSDPGDGIRQLFVAVTRASEELYISAPGMIRGTQLSAQLGGKGRAILADLIVHAVQAATS